MGNEITQAQLLPLARYAMNLREDEKTSMQNAQAQVLAIGGYKAFEMSKSCWDFTKNWSANSAELNALKGATNQETLFNIKRHRELKALAERLPKAPTTPRPTLSANPTAKEIAELQKHLKSDMYSDVRQAINNAKNKTGKDYADAVQEINKKLAEANLKVHTEQVSAAGALKPTSKIAKALYFIKDKTGWNKLKGLGKSALANSSKLRNAANFARGKGILTLAALAPDAIEVGQTYKQLGARAAAKQTGKSLFVAGSAVGGYSAGTAAAAFAGAKIGLAAGSTGGPVGAAIGAVVGLACGLIGSYFATKGAQAIVGKTELEKHNDNQAANLAKEATSDQKALNTLLTGVKERAAQDIASGTAIPENIQKTFLETVQNAASASNVSSSSPSGTQSSAGLSINKNSKLITALENFIKSIKSPVQSNSYAFGMMNPMLMNPTMNYGLGSFSMIS